MAVGLPRIVGVVAGFILLLVTGYGLSRSGRPYGQMLMTVHKLLSVAMLVFIIWRTISASKTTALTTTAWIVTVLASLAFVILIGTGGALSAMTSPPNVVRWFHKIAPYTAIPLTALWLYWQ